MEIYGEDEAGMSELERELDAEVIKKLSKREPEAIRLIVSASLETIHLLYPISGDVAAAAYCVGRPEKQHDGHRVIELPSGTTYEVTNTTSCYEKNRFMIEVIRLT